MGASEDQAGGTSPAPAGMIRTCAGAPPVRSRRTDLGWSSLAFLPWGKTDVESGTWMPTVQHLEDSAAVAARLWELWWPERVKESIARQLPGGRDDARILYAWLAGVHDVGKLCPQFTEQLRRSPVFVGVLDEMAAAGLRAPGRVDRHVPHHSLMGEILVRRWLEAKGYRPAMASRFAGVVGAHHGRPPTSHEVTQLQTMAHELAPTPQWGQVQQEALDRMAERTGATGRIEAWRAVRLSGSAQLLLAGMVVVADWVASDVTRFPLVRGGRPDLEALALDALDTEDFPTPWRAAPGGAGATDLLRARFVGMGSADARPVQEAALAAAREVDGPPLIVVEAGTGEGKTEAALLAAEVLAERFGCGGVIFALPTQATSDGVFPRLQRWVERQPQGGRSSIFLAHGKAALNPEYQRLLSDSRIESVFDDECELDRGPTRPVVTSWLRGRRQGVLASFVVGTIDQVLFAALRARHLPLRQVALAGKVVVIDEVHAADEFMQVYLQRVLEWLGAHGTPVILLSATVPPQLRADLISSYQRGRRREDVALLPDQDDQYPRVTCVSDTVDRVAVASGGHIRREIEVSLIGVEWVDEVVSAVEAGACVAVICNTVDRARTAAEQLIPRLGRDRVGLLHSQFLAVHRAAREQELRRLLGPESTDGRVDDRPDGYVVCATQVLEQSLDIDLDLMVTDLAPMDLLLQRAGRLHRHVRGESESHRPEGYRRPRLLITGVVVGDAGLPELDPGGVAVYGARGLLRCLAVLGLHCASRTVATPDEVAPLVRRAYADTLEPPGGWEEAWGEAERAHLRRVHAQRDTAAHFAVEDPVLLSNLHGLIDGGTADPDTAQGAGMARVRDTEESVEVIVVRRGRDGLRALPGTGVEEHVIPEELDAPEPWLARALATCTVRLPRRFTHPGLIDSTIADLERQSSRLTGWSLSPWLVGELALVLDDDLTGSLLGVPISYDKDVGLRWSRGDRDE